MSEACFLRVWGRRSSGAFSFLGPTMYVRLDRAQIIYKYTDWGGLCAKWHNGPMPDDTTDTLPLYVLWVDELEVYLVHPDERLNVSSILEGTRKRKKRSITKSM